MSRPVRTVLLCGPRRGILRTAGLVGNCMREQIPRVSLLLGYAPIGAAQRIKTTRLNALKQPASAGIRTDDTSAARAFYCPLSYVSFFGAGNKT
jgi:hypothetical protein